MIIDDKSILILEALYDGVLISDENGIVQYVNDSYLRITSMSKEEVLYLPLEKTRPGSKLVDVIRSGKPIRHFRRKVGNVEYYSSLVPIYEEDKIIGGVSISSEVKDVQKLVEKLKKSESMITQLQKKVSQYYQAKYQFEDIIGKSAALTQVKEKAKKFSQGESSILITGESGTGKELFAQSIHNYSHRASGPFIAVNCATLSGELLESELFGYASGTFTGADKNGKIGLFKAAEGGTIFLDEIGELDIKFQAKLLRVLQEKKIRPLGDNKEYPVDVRIISATNRVLFEMIDTGEFREDLYYRLSVFELEIPPLRERREDIFDLVDSICESNQFPIQIKKVFKEYDWPGNIRELKNTIQFCIELSSDNQVTLEDLPKKLWKYTEQTENIDNQSLQKFVHKQENLHIHALLDKYGYDTKGKKRVAEILEISLATLYNKLNSN